VFSILERLDFFALYKANIEANIDATANIVAAGNKLAIQVFKTWIEFCA